MSTRLRTTAFLLVSAFGVCACSSEASAPIDDDSLVNGAVAKVGSYQSTVALDDLGCTGVLAGSNRILTAAHCVTAYGGEAPQYLLDGLVGNDSFAVTSTQVPGLVDYRRTAFVKVTKVTVAPDYLAIKFAHTLDLPSDAAPDLAVIQFETTDSGKYVIPKIPVAKLRASAVASGEKLSVGGYGCVLATSCDDDEGIDDGLNQALRMGSVVAKSLARDAGVEAAAFDAGELEKYGRIYKNAGGYAALKQRIDDTRIFSLSPGRTDTRIGHGDSGGPVYDKSGRVVAINSSGTETWSSYGRLAPMLSWLRELGCNVVP